MQGIGGRGQEMTFVARTYTGLSFDKIKDDCVLEGNDVQPERKFVRTVWPGDLMPFTSPALMNAAETLHLIAYYPTPEELKFPGRSSAKFCQTVRPKVRTGSRTQQLEVRTMQK